MPFHKMHEHATIADLERRLAAAEAALREKAEVEVALRQSEELRRIAIEGGRMGTWRWDLREERVWGDAAFLGLWGFPPSDTPRPLSDFTDRMSRRGRAEMGEMVTRAVAAGEEFDGQLAVVSGPTDGRWVRWRGRAERARPWIVNGVSFDVTDQRLQEQRLRDSEARHRLLIESWTQAMWETDAAGVVAADSPSWRAYTGQTLEEWLGYGWLNAIHPDDQAYAERQWREAVAARGLVDAEFRLRAPDGGWRWTNVRAAPVLDAGGHIETWAGMNIDIDARKGAEAALRESEERFRRLVEGFGQFSWEATADGSIEVDSPGWRAFTGQRLDQWLGRGWVTALHPDDQAATLAKWQDAVASGSSVDHEYRLWHAPSASWRWSNVRAVPITDPDGSIRKWSGVNIDVTDHHMLLVRQQILVNELQHRSRNLLGVITAVASRTLGDGAAVAAFETRLKALSRAQGLLSQQGSDTVELGALVRAELAAHVQFDAHADAHADADPEAGSQRMTVAGPRVHLSARQVQNFALALHELTTNAVKYGALRSEAGRLSVTWTREQNARGRPCLVLDWIESGVAMPPEAATRRGSGRELIENALSYALRARTDYAIGADGVRCRIELPLA